MFTIKHMTAGIGAAIIVTLSHAALAADAVEEVIVTGVAAPTTKLSSSYSVTALSADDISDFTPRSTAEIFRNLPGIQAEATGGDSNANIKVRGMPISAGGSRYLSIQEDSLPLLLIGDMRVCYLRQLPALRQWRALCAVYPGGGRVPHRPRTLPVAS